MVEGAAAVSEGHPVVAAVMEDPVVKAAISEAGDPETAKQAAVDTRKAVAASEDASALMTAGQRRINLLWETTQAVIAILVTAGTLIVSGLLVLKDGEKSATAFLLLSNAFFMIVTAYFQRTNHTREGGVGRHDLGR